MFKLLGMLWTLPNTVLGVTLALLGGARPFTFVDGFWLWGAQRGRWWFWFFDKFLFGAITFGQMAIFNTEWAKESELKKPEHFMHKHERRHMFQYMLLGPLFLPVYLVLSVFYGYFSNPLEKDARNSE